MLSDDDMIEHERIRAVLRHAPLTAAVSVINAVIVAYLFSASEGGRLPALWVTAVAVTALVKLLGARRLLRRRTTQSRLPATTFSVCNTLVNGVLWGMAATLLFPPEEAYQLFLALAICGMCAGAVTVNATHWPTATAFILPSSLPLAWSFFTKGPAWQAATLMVIVFATSMSILGSRTHRTFGESIALHIAFSREQKNLSEANIQLQAEVTQRRTAEATLYQVQKIEAIGHLTGGIAHDFNNLLQVITGNLNLIKRLSADNKRISDYAVAAETAAARGAELTTSLLTFARRQVLEVQFVSLNDLLAEFKPILLRTLGPNIQCAISCAPDLPACNVDPAHFQSAVLNLVINARDAMPDGGELTIRTGHAILQSSDLRENPDASPGQFAHVSVRDTGTGISPDVLARVFEPFFTTKEVGKGSGLGLSQVYGFARQSGGLVQLLTEPSKGTEVILWLPAAAT